MRKAVVCCLALLAIGAASPALAGILYLPLIEQNGTNGAVRDTEIWVSNGGTVQRSFVTTFLRENTDGSKRTGVPSSARIRIGANGTFRLGNSAPANQLGLLEIDAAPQLLVDARLVTKTQSGTPSYTAVPVISSDNMIGSGDAAHLLGLERRSDLISDLSVVNLGKTSASCAIKLQRSNGTEITAANITVQALSLRRFGDALAGQTSISDARAVVECNRDFFAFATLTDLGNGRISFAVPSASGASSLTAPGSNPNPNPNPDPSGNALVYEIPGTVLVPSRSREVREEHIPVQRALSLKRMIIEMDFTVGPWASREPDGPHAVLWLYRGRYASNTIANVNIHGPRKNKIRMNQNVDLIGRAERITQQGGVYETGKTYRFFYNYNAEGGVIRVRVTEGNRVVNDITWNEGMTASRRTLTIPGTGFNVVFGHRGNLHYEVPSYGWTYSNFRVTMVPY
jgi:hypothetical protein